MRKLRFIECSDGTRAHVGDTISMSYDGQTYTGVLEEIHADLKWFEIRSGDELHHGFVGNYINIELIERKKR